MKGNEGTYEDIRNNLGLAERLQEEAQYVRKNKD